MSSVDTISSPILPLSAPPASQERRVSDSENSTLLKIAACIPLIGPFVCQFQSLSINRKLKKLPLPEKLRPDPMFGKIMDKDASPAEKKTACERAAQLHSMAKDYNNTALVCSILSVALGVYALAINVIPFVVGAIFIGGNSLLAVMFVIIHYVVAPSDNYYEEMGAHYEKKIATNV